MAYELIDHPADVGVRVTSETIQGLFEQAALALADLAGASSTAGSMRTRVEVEGIDTVDLLVRWLQELLYLMEVKGLRLASVEVTRLGDTGLSALVSGERAQDLPTGGIKAVTYHGLEIRHIGDSFEAVIIFDT
ncbi:MAG: archease [Desulfomonilia bacterium]|jgi:SHS2 domain-containing protein